MGGENWVKLKVTSTSDSSKARICKHIGSNLSLCSIIFPFLFRLQNISV